MTDRETERLAALARYGILDTPPEPAYDDITRLAAAICETPIALVSLIDEHRQWFKSRFGIEAVETPREMAFCHHAILGNEPFIVPDACEDNRFANNPCVAGETKVRFYAGLPLTTDDGYNLGTLCVVDRRPRSLTPVQLEALRLLAKQVVACIGQRTSVRKLVLEARELESFHVLFENATQACLIVSTTVGIVDCNLAALTMLRHERKSEIIGLHPAVLSPDRQPDGRNSADKFDEMVSAATKNGGFHRFDWWHRRSDGEEFPCEVSIKSMVLNGRPFLLVSWDDLTGRRRTEAALRTSEIKFRTVIDRLGEGFYLIDPAAGTILESNAALQRMLGYSPAELAGMANHDLIAGHDRAAVSAAVRANLAVALPKLRSDGRCQLGQCQYRRKDGGAVDVEVLAAIVPGCDGELVAFIVRDVTEQRAHEQRLFDYQLGLEEANSKLKALASTDGLTGANNRKAFDERLAEAFERADRFGEPLSLILLDVDRFKLFNDTFGHPAGDDVLRSVAQALLKAARVTDSVARYGGEEFAIILPETELAGAMIVAERCLRDIAALPWSQRAVTASIGVATKTNSVEGAADLLRAADLALYRSKQSGRNRVNHSSGLIPMLAANRM